MSNKNGFRLSEDEINRIVEDYKLGMTIKEIHIKYNRSVSTIIGKLTKLGIYYNYHINFTDEDIKFLKIYYPIGNWDIIFERFPSFKKQDIFSKMSSLNIKMDSFFWSDDDIDILKINYVNCNIVDDIVKLLNNKFTYKAITTKAKRLGLKTREFWSNEEINLLKVNYPNKTLEEIEILLPNRNRKTIIAKASVLNIRNLVKYSKEQEKFIIDNWISMSDEDMATCINKTKAGVIGKRLLLGLLRLKEKSSYNDLSEYVRRNNLDWKKASIKSCNYKCLLTGERFQAIHHIYGLNLIINETLEDLNIDVRESMDNYTKEELRNILEVFRIKQNNYPLGICLRDDVHKLFHNIYGYGNNTVEQWDEFTNDFKNNKYEYTLKQKTA